MAKHHYLPAVYIAQFSGDERTTIRSREKRVWVNSRIAQKCFTTKAANVGYRVNLYTQEVDHIWESTEQNLKQAIEAFTGDFETPVLSTHWFVMVNFIAQLFVRGYEFDKRFEQRLNEIIPNIKEKMKEVYKTSMAGARQRELQRLYAPVMYADWKIIRNTSAVPLITNDFGYYHMLEPEKQFLGYAIPLTKYHLLSLTVGKRSGQRVAPLVKYNNEWVVSELEYREIDEVQVYALNNAIGQHCLNEIYGPTLASVNFELVPLDIPIIGHQADYLVPNADPSYLKLCEMDYFGVITMMEEQDGKSRNNEPG